MIVKLGKRLTSILLLMSTICFSWKTNPTGNVFSHMFRAFTENFTTGTKSMRFGTGFRSNPTLRDPTLTLKFEFLFFLLNSRICRILLVQFTWYFENKVWPLIDSKLVNCHHLDFFLYYLCDLIWPGTCNFQNLMFN